MRRLPQPGPGAPEHSVPTSRTRSPCRALVSLCAVALAAAACSSGGATGAAPTSSPSPASPSPTASASAEAPDDGALSAALAGLEAERGARVGVFAVDTATGRSVAHRADERFAYASTFKALLAGVILDRTTDGELDELVRFERSDLVSHSPVTSDRLGTGMTLRELCAAAVQVSDNGAANLLLERVGGPAALDAALADLGDNVIEVVRTEPDLNAAVPRDSRDTTTPRALATTLQAMTVGDALAPPDRAQLLAWLRGSTTGAALVRAVVPPDAVVADKTGTGGYGTRNVVAVVEAPGRAPVVVAVMTTHDRVDARPDDALVAAAAREALGVLAP